MKTKNFKKAKKFWYQNIPHVLNKKMNTLNLMFSFTNKKVKDV